jgi:hypothetical protein
MLASVQIKDLTCARSAIDHHQRQAVARRIALRTPPPEPTTCCGRGCNGCVWEGYYAALQYWLEDARTALGASGGERV